MLCYLVWNHSSNPPVSLRYYIWVVLQTITVFEELVLLFVYGPCTTQLLQKSPEFQTSRILLFPSSYRYSHTENRAIMLSLDSAALLLGRDIGTDLDVEHTYVAKPN